jgi:large subunit ribosomal protein L15
MKPHELKPPKGSHTARTRVGRGEASGKGKTAGRGTKGTRARGSIKPFFEGGQMPLVRRVPKLKGFTPPNRIVYAHVNVKDLDRIETASIGPAELRRAGLIGGRDPKVKILGTGDVVGALPMRAHAFSATAREKIASAGGSVEVIEVVPSRKKGQPK